MQQTKKKGFSQFIAGFFHVFFSLCETNSSVLYSYFCRHHNYANRVAHSNGPLSPLFCRTNQKFFSTKIEANRKLNVKLYFLLRKRISFFCVKYFEWTIPRIGNIHDSASLRLLLFWHFTALTSQRPFLWNGCLGVWKCQCGQRATNEHEQWARIFSKSNRCDGLV